MHISRWQCCPFCKCTSAGGSVAHFSPMNANWYKIKVTAADIFAPSAFDLFSLVRCDYLYRVFRKRRNLSLTSNNDTGNKVIVNCTWSHVCRDSSVGIATELRARGSGDRIPVGARFSAAVQTGHGAHPASYTMGTGSFPGVMRPGRGVDHPPPSSAKVKERVQLYLYSPLGLRGMFYGELDMPTHSNLLSLKRLTTVRHTKINCTTLDTNVCLQYYSTLH
jgi:hypothetical protein